MTGKDETGGKLNRALIIMMEKAKTLQRKKSTSHELRTLACSLKEQADWAREAIQNQHDWDVEGIEECIGFMKTNVDRMSAMSEQDSVILQIVKKYARIVKCWKACLDDMVWECNHDVPTEHSAGGETAEENSSQEEATEGNEE